MLVSSVSLQAQNFDEENLVGKWKRSAAMQPVDNYLVSIDSLFLGNGLWTYEAYGGTTEYLSGVFYGQWQGSDDLAGLYNVTRIRNFSITNGNKLHIGVYRDFTLMFKIVSLTSTELVLQPFGSSNQIRFRKVSTTSGINGAKVSSLQGASAIYDVTGKKLSKKNKGLNIIKPANGAAYKEVVN